MLLKKVFIHKYKNFSEQEITIEDDITCIVGKNESGKTAILESIVNTNKNNKFDIDIDYPRYELSDIDINNINIIEAVSCYYILSDTDILEIENEFGKSFLKDKEIKITKCYGNNIYFTLPEYNYDIFKSHISSTVSELSSSDIENIKSSNNIMDLINALSNLTENLKNYIENIKNISGFDKLSKDDDIIHYYIYNKFIKNMIPNFLYFSDYHSIPYRIDINTIIENNKNESIDDDDFQIIKYLLELSNLNPEDIKSEDNFERFKSRIEATSNSITSKMFEYWKTNDNLEIKFDIEHRSNNSRFLNIRIYNSKYRLTLPVKNRSKGFIWFFSFLIWFSRIGNNEKHKYILLLDEPGLSLHASAQKDLLRFINEKIEPFHQIIYSTHSPFMIDSLRLNKIRTVYDSNDRNKGSTILEALEEKDSETLFPLQAALGYNIAQNLYISKNNLLVEGISDLVYINHFSSLLNKNGGNGLNDNITIIPVGGAEKIATFISLTRGNNLECVCLLDTLNDQKSKVKLDKLSNEHKIIKKSNIIFYSDIINTKFADIEDLFKKEEYICLFNRAFNQNISIDKIDMDQPIMNQLRKLNNDSKFNHYTPALFMISNLNLINFSNETLNNFDNLFQKINNIFKS